MSSIDLINIAPNGTKLWILHVGDMAVDEGFIKRAAHASSVSDPQPHKEQRHLVMLSMLIEHPTEGLILFETGAGKDYPSKWSPLYNDLFPRVDYTDEKELDAQIKLTGHDIKEIKAVVMGHLHLDHAGGLEYFQGTNVPIYVHELELKQAFYAVASKQDYGVYTEDYLTFDLNWQPFSLSGNDVLEIAQGINIRHAPGHTAGLCVMQVNMPDSGTWLFTTDMYHVWENYEGHVGGWLLRDQEAWMRSHQMIRWLVKRTNAKVVLGHCAKTVSQYKMAPHAYT